MKKCDFLCIPKGPGYFYDMYMAQKDQPVYIGVDWAIDSGMTRGNIISREGNVIYVRFKTVVI